MELDQWQLCHLCDKRFKTVRTRNVYIKTRHKVTVFNPEGSHIICPLCEEKTVLRNHEELRKHLEKDHQLRIKLLTFEFSNKEEYDSWKEGEKIETNYAMNRSSRKNGYKLLYYDCNRSDNKGYKPNYNKRTEKSGGTIKIKGVCPSRLICKLYNEGKVSVTYWQTHAGHEEELRSKHLSKTEKNMVVEMLQCGIPPTRILEDSRKLGAPKLERINLITGQDITNLSKKYNIQKKQDQNEKLSVSTDDILDTRMWKMIADFERPNANNYQDRVIIKAHKKAEEIKDIVKIKEDNQISGYFKLKYCSIPNSTYIVNSMGECEDKCRILYCRVCKICIHQYQCNCSEYVLKNTLCKHVHLVKMYEKQKSINSVLDAVAASSLGRNSFSKTEQEEEIIIFQIEDENGVKEEIQEKK